MWCRHVFAASLGFIAVTQCSILGSLLLMLSQLKPPFFFFLTFLSSVRLSFRKEVFFCFLGRGAANLNLHTRVSLLWIPNGIPLTYFKSNSSVTGPNLLTFCEQAGGARGGPKEQSELMLSRTIQKGGSCVFGVSSLAEVQMRTRSHTDCLGMSHTYFGRQQTGKKMGAFPKKKIKKNAPHQKQVLQYLSEDKTSSQATVLQLRAHKTKSRPRLTK